MAVIEVGTGPSRTLPLPVSIPSWVYFLLLTTCPNLGSHRRDNGPNHEWSVVYRYRDGMVR